MKTTPHLQLDTLRLALERLRGEQGTVAELSDMARAQAELLAALPPRYTDVLNHVLDRLESSALFSGESCSFSQTDLLDSLQMWLDKAQLQLAEGQGV